MAGSSGGRQDRDPDRYRRARARRRLDVEQAAVILENVACDCDPEASAVLLARTDRRAQLREDLARDARPGVAYRPELAALGALGAGDGDGSLRIGRLDGVFYDVDEGFGERPAVTPQAA